MTSTFFTDSIVGDESDWNRVILVRATYSKNPDRLLFDDRTYYVLDSERNWIAENNYQISQNASYKALIEASKAHVSLPDIILFSDPVHRVLPKNLVDEDPN